MVGQDGSEEPDALRQFPRFWRDVQRSVRHWRTDRRLPVAAIGTSLSYSAWGGLAAATGQGWLAILSIFFGLLFLGFYGAERIWYVLIDRGASASWTEIWQLTNALRGRYLRFAVLFGLIAVGPTAVVIAALHDQPIPLAAALFLVLAVLDILFTFATPGLAFNAVSPIAALRHSVAVLRAQWPQSRWYALAPALAITAVTVSIPRHALPLVLRLALDALVVAAALLCKGATVLFYADRYPTIGDRRSDVSSIDAWTGSAPRGATSGFRPKSAVTAGLLAVFLGVFGAHRFYLGSKGLGLTMLLASVLTLGFLAPLVFTWGAIEGVLLLIGVMRVDSEGRPLT